MNSKNESITLLPYRDRVKLVQDRLRYLRTPNLTHLPKPANVRAAEKIVHDWLEKDEKNMDRQRLVYRSKLNAIQDALILGDMTTAVKLLQQLGA